MARDTYTGVPEVEPQLGASADYEHIETSPSTFGGQVGEGLTQLGDGLMKTSEFYGQVAADNATNNFLDGRDKILYGDPSKTVTGPDGQPAPDTGYFGLRGADAMRAAPEVEQNLNDMIADQREGLTTQTSRQAFEVASRRYRAQALEQVSQHADQQQKIWATDTNTTAATLALNQVSRVAADPLASAVAGQRVIDAYTKNAQLAGQDPRGAALKAGQDVALTRIRALIGSDNPGDRAAAQSVLDASAGILGSLPNYDGIVRTVKGAVTEATLDPTVDGLVAGAVNGARGGGGAAGFAGALPRPSADAQLDAPDRTRGQSTVQYFTSKGLPAVMGAGIAANLYAESGIDPNPKGSNDGGSAYGSFQAHEAYQRSFEEHMGKPIQGSSLQDQYDFLHWDLTAGPDKATGDKMMAAKTPEEAARLFMLGIERPKDQSGQAVADREAIARQIAGGTFAPGPGAAVGAPAAVPTNAPVPPPPMSVADNLRTQMPQLVDNARASLERQFPNQPDVVDRGVDRFERQLNVQISQQDQQYLVDTHVVQAAMTQSRPTSEQDLVASSPQVADAWQRMQVQNPLAAAGVQRMFDANARGAAAQFGTEFKGALDRVLAPDGDPSRIKDPSGLWSSVGSGPDAALTNSGIGALSALTRMRGTPTGEAAAAQIRQFADTLHGELTYSNPGVGRYDVQGEARYAKFMAVALPQIEAAQKSGTLGNALNPNSPDYIGRAALPFMRTRAQMMKDAVTDPAFTPGALTVDSLTQMRAGLDNDAQWQEALKAAVASGRLTRPVWDAYQAAHAPANTPTGAGQIIGRAAAALIPEVAPLGQAPAPR